MPNESKDRPLTIGVEGEELLVRIGIETLAYCFHLSPDNNPYDEDRGDFSQAFQVTGVAEFARGVALGLQDEAEDGSSPLTVALDKATTYAVEGAYGVEECPRGSPSAYDREYQEAPDANKTQRKGDSAWIRLTRHELDAVLSEIEYAIQNYREFAQHDSSYALRRKWSIRADELAPIAVKLTAVVDSSVRDWHQSRQEAPEQ